jgi:flavin reductase (DIM6/NTAB) family NADH-FMN oxidoreductase RutF
MSKTPPILAIGIQANTDGSMKDSARNILDTGEFVVNLVTRAAAQSMNITSIDAPADVDELALADIETVPSVKVKTERIAASPVAFECRLHTPVEVAPSQLIVLGQIVQAHVADAFVLDPLKCYIDTPALHLIGRMHGRGWYTPTDDIFQMERPAPYMVETR